ncbi:MAG: hypothetical protein GX593_05630 [Actinomycetales bacterium]|nr:hypothetical protein [Actinomycetales bacterium]
MNADQFSPASADALRDSAARLAEVLQRYATATGSMAGQTNELEEIFALNAQVSALAAELNDKAFDHTGTLPLPLDLEGNAHHHVEESDDDEGETVEAESLLSSVSRWNLAVTDLDQLLAAGREAHRQTVAGATAQDAALEITEAADAVHAILEARPEPWFEIPGIAVMHGLRLLIEPEDVPEQFDGDLENAAGAVLPPAGPLLIAESWG